MAKDVVAMVRREGNVVTLSKGGRARVTQMPVSIMDAVQNKFPDPVPPMVMIEEKGREEPNPNDPDYLDSLVEMRRKRGEATIDAMYILCVDLVDGMVDDNEWLPQLRFLNRMTGVPDMEKYDLDNPDEKQLLYLKYWAIGRSDFDAITKKCALAEEDIREAEAAFRSNAERDADTES